MLKKIWNYRADPERFYTVQARALRGLLLFLAVMVCCTIVSCSASNMTLAIVQAARPQRMSIAHTVTASGTLEAVDRTAVVAEPGALVRRLLVKEGDTVEESDLLFVLDTSELQRQLSEKQLDLQRLQLQWNTLAEKTGLEEEQRDVELERARLDYEYAKERAERASAAALDEMNEARRAVDFFDGDEYDDKEAWDNAMKNLRSEYRSKIRGYEQALSDEAETLEKAERAIADAGKAPVDIEGDLLQIDIQLKQLDIARIQQTLAASGEIYAPRAGIVSDLKVDVGSYTPSEAVAYLVGEESLRFTTEITEEEKKYVERGSALSLTLSGNQRPVENLSVTTLTPIAGGSSYRITVDLPAGTGAADLSATAEIRQTTQTYNTCVPLSCLYSEMSQYYVLVLGETETALGVEQSVRRVDVTLEDSNETMAAISGALFGDDRVVRASDRPIADGDRVRLQEGA